MSVNVICLTSGAGLPVFTRKKGNAAVLPFSVIGSLNGVHMYAKLQKLELLNSFMDDHCAVWREFHDSIILIGISSGCTPKVLNKCLESVFNAMVLVVGIDEIKSQKNVERLKRELRLIYPIIDRILDSLDYGDTSNKGSSKLIMMPETVLFVENQSLQIVLDSYTECVDSVYSCVLIHGKVAVCTESWWSLHPDEINMLSLLASIDNTTSSKDIPVFLPYTSNTVAYRFVSCVLMPNVQVCSLCGPTPSLQEIEHSAFQCFKSTLEILNSALHSYPRNILPSLDLELGILGVLLINVKIGKYMITQNVTCSSEKQSSSSSYRLDILRTFYYQVVMGMISVENQTGTLNSKKEEKTNKMARKQDKHIRKAEKTESTSSICKESYWCLEYNKCHATINEDNILCVLYDSTIPTLSMSFISPRILKAITDKQFCW